MTHIAATLQSTGADDESSTESFMGYTLSRTNKLSKALQVISSVFKFFKRWKHHKALQVISSVFKFFKRWKHHALSKATNDESENRDQAKFAFLALVKIAQHECFANIIQNMRMGATFERAVKSLTKPERKSWAI